MFIAVFDIGGTSVKYGIVNETGDILTDGSFPSDAHLGGEAIVQNVIAKSLEMMRSWKIEGISISTAGQIDHTEGVVVHATDNIPGYTGTPIKQQIENATGLTVAVENDVNCTAIGEFWKGAAQGVDDFLCVTIGTGIGGALYINGQLYAGSTFAAGEIGHMTLYPGGKACTCGGQGCWEQYGSSSALEALVTETYGYPIDLKAFFDRVQSGDQTAISVYHHWIDDLTTGLKSIVHTLNPALIVFGGGISAQGGFLRDSIETALLDKVMPNHGRQLKVKMAHHFNMANLLGAAKHFLDVSHKG